MSRKLNMVKQVPIGEKQIIPEKILQIETLSKMVRLATKRMRPCRHIGKLVPDW